MKIINKLLFVRGNIIKLTPLPIFYIFIKIKGNKKIIILLNNNIKYNIINKIFINRLGF